MGGASNGANKQRKGKLPVPVDTSSLRRNNRSTKYDGFRVPQPSDTHLPKSKVKPHINPAAPVTSEDSLPQAQDVEVPPPTIIKSMQAIGTQLCAIPAEELTVAAPSKPADGSTSSI